jgi:hypothetical protein
MLPKLCYQPRTDLFKMDQFALGGKVGLCASSSAKAVISVWLGGLAELGFLELLEIAHIEVAVGLEPVLVSFDGKGSNEASTSV